jgi:tRNA (cytidine/uridine-2'-O-)-methyltransferase
MQYEPLLHVVLYQPEIPPNTGNIGRTCVAIGAKLWLVKPLGFQINEKELRRAGLDYWPYLEWETVENWGELTQRLADPIARRQIWLLTKRGEVSYTTAKFERGDILLFGCETSGLPDELLTQYADRTLRIPMRPQVRSLNLSSSAALVMYEAVRQLGAAEGFE